MKFAAVSVLSVLLAGACTSQSTPASQPSSPASQPSSPAEPPPVPTTAEAPAPEPAPAPPVTPAGAPENLGVIITLPDPPANLASLAAFADAISPGTGANFTLETLQTMVQELAGTEIPGLDLTQPLHLLIITRNMSDIHPLLVAAITDPDAMPESTEYRVHDGHIAMGEPTALEIAGNYALTELHSRPLPPTPAATVDMKAVAPLVQQFAAIAKIKIAMAGQSQDPATAQAEQMAAKALDMMLALAEQTETVEVRLELDAAGLTALFALTARPDTTMQRFVAAQKPADYALLGRLPAANLTSVVMAGTLHWSSLGGLLEDMMEMGLSLMQKTSATPVPAGWKHAMMQWMQDWADIARGEFAMSVSPKDGMTMQLLSAVSDTARARDLIRRADELTLPSMVQQQRSYRVQGRDVHEVKTAVVSVNASPEQVEAMRRLYPDLSMTSAYTVANDLIVMAGSTKDARKVMTTLLRSVLAKKPPAPKNSPMAAVVSESLARKESMFFYFDVTPFMPPQNPLSGRSTPMVLGAGFAGNTFTLRFAMPVTTIQAFQTP